MSFRINNPRIGALLQRAFGLQGRVRPVLEEFVIPVVSLGDLSEGTEPPIVRHASAFFNQGAVVGERLIWRFEAIGGTICVIRKIFLRQDTGAANAGIGFPGNAATLAALATTATKGFTDGRLLAGNPRGGPQQPSGVLTHDTQAASVAAQWQTRIPDAGGLTFTPPGNSWVIGTGGPLVGFMEGHIEGANLAGRVTIEWDEYQLV